MNNLDLWNKVRSVPDEAKKEIKGGRLNGKTDINPVWRLKALTEQFGPCGDGWYYEITDKRLEKGGQDEVSAFVDILLYYKTSDGWSKGIPGTGGSAFVAKEKSGPYTSDECFKMALTDAISVACKALGVGADVYWEKDKSKYDAPQRQPEPPKQDPKPDKKAELIDTISRAIYPNGKQAGPDGWAYEIFVKLMTKYNGLDKRIKSLKDLNLNQLEDMMQQLMPECLK